MLRLFHTDDPSLFQHKTQASLERDEAANNLMLGVSQQLVKSQQNGRGSEYDSNPGMAWVEDDQWLTAVGLMTPPYCLILYCEPVQKISSLKLLLDFFDQTHLPGVIGKTHVVETFAGLWRDRQGSAINIHRKGRVYKLTAVLPTPFTSGFMRLAEAVDLEQMIEWSQAFDKEALNGEEGEAVAGRTRLRIQNKELFVWEDNLVTAMAVKHRPTQHGVSISYVYTPPALRGRGYASALVSTLSQYSLTAGHSFCTLMTDLANPASNHIYQKMGYKPVCDIEEIHFA